MTSCGVAVEADQVSLFRQSKSILDGVTFNLYPGTLNLLFGPNGGGKSTLLRVLSGLEVPKSGSILIDGLSPREARKIVGYVPQRVFAQPHIPLSVANAVRMGLVGLRGVFYRFGREDNALVSEALNEVELSGRENDDVRTLSGGELQRVYIARALVRKPKLLLLDEATSGVDIGVKGSLLSLVENLKSRMTILFVTHDMSVVSEAVDVVLCLQRVLVSHGKPTEALSDATITRMYGNEAQPFMHCHVPHRHVDGDCC